MSLVHIERSSTFSPRLCKFCQYLISCELDKFKFRGRGISYPEKDAASKRRAGRKPETCALCAYVISILDAKGTKWRVGEKDMARTTRGICYPIADADTRGCMEVSLGDAARLVANLNALLFDPTRNVVPPVWSGVKLENSQISRLAIAKIWLDNCFAHHDRCKTLESSTRHVCPTRLIDISSENPHLVITATDTRVKYVALSHCWGLHQPIITTMRSLKNHELGIPFLSMPKTFRDAIIVSRHLGIQYIWIDSLCIIQDSPPDWAYEAARMASVYSGALFTIAAAWGFNGTCGCFHDHLPTLHIRRDEQQKVGTHITDSSQHLYLRPVSESRRYLGNAMLNTRAWTLQEIVLSRRVLLFAEDQMYWFCTSLHETEDGLMSIPDVADAGLSLPSLGPVLRNGKQSRDLLYESWQVTMKSYTSRNLTKGQDKFAALAGITEFFASIIKDEPVAGLWKGDLVRGLMWKMAVGKHGTIDSDVVASLGIPTWSWAKVKGQIDTSVSDTEVCAGDLEANVRWEGFPMTSKIADAFVTGRARMLKILNVEKSDDKKCFCLGARMVTVERQPRKTMTFKVYWYMDECKEVLEVDLRFLLVRFNDVRETRGNKLEREVSALIVKVTENTYAGHICRRVGLGDIMGMPLSFYEHAKMVGFELL